ncbi:S4 domain-containing protein [Asaia astilbis]|uniref:S4 domain-containing protein n=1 Tax=Asaia astilbis TaxID=610244 RepID=UPI000470FBD3|nr:S4 domain-containing protein [Asaia astilbis]
MADLEYQRLDIWLWHARVCRQRHDCAALVERGAVRINRQVTTKPHSKIRIGDVLGLPGHPKPEVRIWRVKALAEKRGSAPEASFLYDIIHEN